MGDRTRARTGGVVVGNSKRMVWERLPRRSDRTKKAFTPIESYPTKVYPKAVVSLVNEVSDAPKSMSRFQPLVGEYSITHSRGGNPPAVILSDHHPRPVRKQDTIQQPVVVPVHIDDQ